MRAFARDHNRLLAEVARGIVDKSPDVAGLTGC
jgi:hypothetical protein